jgi:C1A family cysteine protease
MDINNFKLNFKKSEEDKRDYIYNSSENHLDLLDYRNVILPIRNQGSQGTCYAQSACCMKEWQELKDYGLTEYLSPQFLYNNRFNKYDDDTNNDSGMFGRDVMKILMNVGVCLEKNYHYGRIENKEEIPQELYDEAIKNKIKAYAKVDSIDQLKKCLAENGPCLVGFPVYNYGPTMWLKGENDEFKGGHAMTIVGYNSDGFIIRNSWGNDWCDGGYCIYYYDQWGSHWEIWTTIDNISNVNKPEEKKDQDDIDILEDTTQSCPCIII